MYGLNFSRIDWGSIFILIIISVVVFLICRELICWYWKINKTVALMEEQNRLMSDQNNLLKELFGSGKNPNKEGTPEFGKQLSTVESDHSNIPYTASFKEGVLYEVIKETAINDSLELANSSFFSKPKLKRMLQKGEKVKIDFIRDDESVKGIWASIKTETDEKGWCLFDFLQEISQG